MTTQIKKYTLKDSATISGKGLHTGNVITLHLKPSDSSGIKFIRVDTNPPTSIQADPSNVLDTNRSTTIGIGEHTITTVEHILSALAGKEIYNAIIEVDGPEIPILDGSARPYIELINSVGIVELEEEQDVLIIQETISLRHPESGSEIIAVPSSHFELQVIIDFNNENVAEQTAHLDHIEKYETEIAKCRTFVFTNELETLVDKNLIKGGDIENALVVLEEGMTQQKLDALADKLGVSHKDLPHNGILSKDDLYFKNEMARHKLLDLIGDLTLLGKPIQGKIIATKPGHKINTEFTSILKKEFLKQRKLKGKPHYDPEMAPIKDSLAIQQMLPHRYPFLMVDKIIELNDNLVVGVKNVTFNEELFQGHFPGNPIFPGVLQLEALAQTGGILALNSVEDPGNWDTYFLKIDNVKFKSKVVPGDTLLLKMELLSPIRRGIVHMQGTAYVGDKVVSEGELTAQIVKRTDDKES